MVLPTITAVEDSQKMYDWFEQMRQTQPVWLDESSGCWHVFRYDDVQTVITDYQLFSSERRRQRETVRAAITPQNGRPRGGRSIIAMDPPQHRQYRNLVSSAFTPRAIDKLRGRVAQITQELLDKVLPAGRMDFADDIAYPLPTIVIAEMLGVPASDRPTFQRWADALLRRQLSDGEFFRPSEQQQRDNPGIKRLAQTFEEMADYFEHMLEERKRAPRDDMMSALLQAEVEGQQLSMEDTISFCNILLLAGHVTTTNLLGQAIRCFDENPAALAQLSNEPELMPAAIEEVLRYASPVWRLVRTAKEEVTISGVTIPKDEPIFAWLASANRDKRQFPEPERFDITRTPNRHLAFGHGIHFCIGAPLSRMEASVALPIILKQLARLRVDRSGAQLFEGRLLFGFKHLPITFEPVKGAA
jgi:cytochrome P450